jgi:isopentenyl-diphosphate Delta-isomerase
MSSTDADRVVLVDATDREVGTLEKLPAHQNGGRLHRAFSVLVFDDAGRTLLQRRADGKYHAAGQWANTCCSHPRPGETVEAGAHRRLREEFGFDCPLREAFAFLYEAPVGGGLTEREFDHVLVGRFAGTPRPDPEEIAEFRWAAPEELFAAVRLAAPEYAAWFKIILIHLLDPDHRAAIDRALAAGTTA